MDPIYSFIIKYSIPFSRIAFFLVYFWFGLLKILGSSPAEGLVIELQSMTLSFIPADTFMILLGLFEIILGVSFLVPKLTKIASLIFLGHMMTTFLPIILLLETTWQKFPSLTLEGQYIIKNVVLIGLVWNVLSSELMKESKLPKVEQLEQVPQK